MAMNWDKRDWIETVTIIWLFAVLLYVRLKASLEQQICIYICTYVLLEKSTRIISDIYKNSRTYNNVNTILMETKHVEIYYGMKVIKTFYFRKKKLITSVVRFEIRVLNYFVIINNIYENTIENLSRNRQSQRSNICSMITIAGY